MPQGLEARVSTEEREIWKFVFFQWDEGGFREFEESYGVVFGKNLSVVIVKKKIPPAAFL